MMQWGVNLAAGSQAKKMWEDNHVKKITYGDLHFPSPMRIMYSPNSPNLQFF
jgi:hypothetical protein